MPRQNKITQNKQIHVGPFTNANKTHLSIVYLSLIKLLSKYSHSSSNKIFGKTSNGLFYALSAKKEFTSWLKVLHDENPSLESECLKLLIFDDKTYLEKRHELTDQVSRELDLIRFEQLKLSIDIEDPSQLIPLLPSPILNAHISQLGLTVRTSNVFSVQGIFCGPRL